MDDILIDLGVSAALRSVKNPKKSAKLRKALAKVYVAIEHAAVLDEALQAAINAKRAGEA